ncbi:MAG: hypothetical protein HKN37_16735 [Rhodothermales bacterium]|nr:hypothetical protein [Rhodothermales bacterium]
MTPPALFSGDDGTVLLILSAAVAAITIVVFFFAGMSIVVRAVSNRRDRRQSRLRDFWMEPVLDALADPDHSPFRHNILRKDRLLFLEMLAQLSVTLAREDREQLVAIARPYMETARALRKDRDAEFRALSVQLLGLLGSEEHRGLLIVSMWDPSPLVALAAIRALSRARGPDDIELVFRELPRFEKWGSNLLSTLLASFGNRGVDHLREVMADDGRRERDRVAAAGALLKLNDYESSGIAQTILQASPGRELGAVCLRLIKRLGRPVQAGLLEHLASSDDPVIRLHAVSALAAIGGDENVDVLTMALCDPSQWVAMRASQGLKDMNRLDRLQALAEMNHPRARLVREYLREGVANA